MVPLRLTKAQGLTQAEKLVEDLSPEQPMHQGFAALEAVLAPRLILKISLGHLPAERGGEGRPVNLLSMMRHQSARISKYRQTFRLWMQQKGRVRTYSSPPSFSAVIALALA